jgi:hypothetical protein
MASAFLIGIFDSEGALAVPWQKHAKTGAAGGILTVRE